VTNLEGLNVSLSTEHKNSVTRRRLNVHQANYFLRNRLGVEPRTADVSGLQAHAKQALARGLRVAGKLLNKKKSQFEYPKSFLVDPDAPRGFRLLNEDAADMVAPHLEHELELV
jgi:hypothetical protein